MDGLQEDDMMDKQSFIDGYAAARKAYLRRERERKILAKLDYDSYRSHVARQQRNGTFRSNRPKGIKA